MRDPWKTVRNRFFAKVKKTKTCWLWTAYIGPNGYGMISVGRGNFYTAHQMSFMLHWGRIPEGKLVMHSCDNKLCVNPKHLEIGTHSQNLKDAYKRGLREIKKVCIRGHVFDRFDSYGRRDCTKCQTILNKRYWAEGRYSIKGDSQ